MPQNPSVDLIPGPDVVLTMTMSSRPELHCPSFTLGIHPPLGRGKNKKKQKRADLRPVSQRPGTLGLGYRYKIPASDMEHT